MAIEDLKIKSESWTWQRNDPVLLIQVTLLLSPTKTTYIRDLLCNTYYRDVGTMWSIHSETCHPLQCEVCLVYNVDHRCHGIGPLSICSANAICLEHFPIQLYLHLCAFAWVCAYLCWADLNCCENFKILKVTQNIWKVTQNMHLVVVVVTDTQKIKVLQSKKFIELQN